MSETTVVKRSFLPKRRSSRILVITLLIIAALLLTTITSAYLYLRLSLPATRGTITLSELENPVTVYRDENGVPHIEASNLHDLYVAQGFVTAQDRLFQMDLSRRQASGLLSEVMGEGLLERDKFFRTFGLRRAAEASYEIYSPKAKQILQWYADGVNAFMENENLPVEFTLAGYKPSEWTPIDSLTIGKYMAYDLGGHWTGQAFRHYLLQNFSEDKALELFPTYPEDGALNIEEIKLSSIDIAESFAGAHIPNEYNGSNNWVVAGEKTESGLPLLADDPHLGLGTPSIWYETHLKSEDVNVSGVIFAGVPGIIVGRNDYIAWGVTNVGPDVQDLYIEKRNPDNPYEFLYKNTWEQAEVVKETIPVKDSEPVEYEIVITRHGPIFSEFALPEASDTALALKWTGHMASTELEAVLEMNRATNWDEFKEALTYFHTPAQNFVFASTDGTIAYRANGLIPIREKGNSIVPVPGWTGEYEWNGFIPWDELPTTVNPEEGFVATANNKVIGDSYPYHLSNTWAEPYRQERIQEVLRSKDKLSVEDMKALQNDFYSKQAEQLLPVLLDELKAKQSELTDVEQEAMELLAQWNYVEDVSLPQPLVFGIWMEEYVDYLFEDRFPEDIYKLMEGEDLIVADMIVSANNGDVSSWMSDKGGLEQVTVETYKIAVARSVEEQGSNPEKWQWGEFHQVYFDHPLSAIEPLHLFFDPKGPVPMGGGQKTVGRAGWNEDTGIVTHGAPWRTVVDLSDMTKSWNVVAPGQSGHRLSRWYGDQIDEWTSGQYHATYIEGYENTNHRLVLKPK
ncbi:penicillin acylase family protein [Bacillus salinus]|uniref:penicillin acylase family protein n=1 Tax=Bacillus sp. HMF5848 TaxID=2495421 RepID=UPI0021ADEB8F|nr:penicillin acylase family protein [Bacillus sp. HMF5848]